MKRSLLLDQKQRLSVFFRPVAYSAIEEYAENPPASDYLQDENKGLNHALMGKHQTENSSPRPIVAT